MRTHKYILALAASGITLASVVDAATIRYQTSGNWNQTTDTTPGVGWQGASVPGLADEGRINWGGNTVTVNSNEQIGRLQIAVDEPGNVIVANGGTLSTISGSGQDGRLIVGNNDVDQLLGTLEVQTGGAVNTDDILWTGLGTPGLSTIAGVVNVGSHLWTGWDTGVTGTVVVNNGGILNVSGQLGLNWQNNGAVGLLNITNGGVVNLQQIHSSGNSIRGTSLLTISAGGLLTKTGDFTNVIQTQYVDTNKIVGEGGATLSVTYDSNNDLTRVEVVPEPSSALLLGISGLGILLRRRRS